MKYLNNGELNKLLIDNKNYEEIVKFIDIKPSNIFLMAYNSIKLNNFGISKNVSKFSDAALFISTSRYISPEIIKKIS